MFARSIQKMLLSMIFTVVVFGVDARACDHMAPVAASGGQLEATPAQRASTAAIDVDETAEVVRAYVRDVDGCLPRCCQSSVCCHLMMISAFPDLWSAGGDDIVALVAADVTPGSTEPDVPPPKAL